jgi:cytochrome c-type biogenesis protein CcmH
MTIFWTLAAGLMLLAVLFVAAPLLGSRRAAATDADIDQERLNLDLFKQQLAELDADLAAGKLERTQYESARRDLERELLRDTASLGPNDPKPGADVKLPGPLLTAAALVFAIPAMALLLYWGLGASHLIPELELAGAGGGQQHAGAAGMPSLDILVQRLEERLAERPDDGEGWTMLGRTYFAMRRTDDAEQAFARAHELLPDDVAVTLAYAESIAANNQSSLEGKPAELVSAALAADPENATARWLAGMVAFQRGQYQAAATAWKRVLSQVDPASEDAAELKQLIDQAEQRAGVPLEMRIAANATADAAEAPAEPAQPAPADRAPANDTAPAPAPAPAAEPAPAPPAVTEPAAPPEQPAATSAGLDVTVALAPALAGRLPPQTPVFVFARAAAGPPMPLAVQRLTVADLPATVHLDDSMAMMPGMSLSAFPQVVVGARVSPSGQAMPQPGDLEGQTAPISGTAAGTVSVTIDRIRP